MSNEFIFLNFWRGSHNKSPPFRQQKEKNNNQMFWNMIENSRIFPCFFPCIFWLRKNHTKKKRIPTRNSSELVAILPTIAWTKILSIEVSILDMNCLEFEQKSIISHTLKNTTFYEHQGDFGYFWLFVGWAHPWLIHGSHHWLRQRRRSLCRWKSCIMSADPQKDRSVGGEPLDFFLKSTPLKTNMSPKKVLF